ncbi:MAG: hydrogenase formation protein HypD [Deltaproteobacteria bacterium]|nr:hydrogenase formation protein HypD [Deltaproteobacteria bacterium]
MKFVREFRDGEATQRCAETIAREARHHWTIMEVCGGQTHSIMRFGLDALLPPAVELVHGPGCPVCVTPLELIDKALVVASRDDVIFCSFGDMLRVPGSDGDLFTARARGADVRIVYAPTDAVAVAHKNPDKQVVFFAVGFETTAPANALALLQAHTAGLTNFSMLVSHVLVPPAVAAIARSPTCRVQGLLAAGHVCTVMGYAEYEPLAAQYRLPIVVTGFEPVDILSGILACIRQLEQGQFVVENGYGRAVRREGNAHARAMIEEVFEVTDRVWRGIGVIAESGYRLRAKYAAFDAEVRFSVEDVGARESTACRSGLVLQGLIKPNECSEFAVRCTPENPLGATMVSSEGACAAYHRYRRRAMGREVDA